MSRSARRGKPLEQYAVAPVLEALGASQVPRMRGDSYRQMKCPFHDDKHASAGVSEFGFGCLACGERGNAITLLMKWEGLSSADAVTRAQELTGSAGGLVPQKSGWRHMSLLAGSED